MEPGQGKMWLGGWEGQGAQEARLSSLAEKQQFEGKNGFLF